MFEAAAPASKGNFVEVPKRFVSVAPLALAIGVASLSTAKAHAQERALHHGPAVATDSAVFVERLAGGNGRRLEPASQFARGERVVTVVTWYKMGGNGGFVLTTPLPAGLAYQRSASEGQEVSVDGGRTWGQLGALHLNGRQAGPQDVTHVRWRIPADSAALGRGRIAYAGIVR
jgi:hypothetical protein